MKTRDVINKMVMILMLMVITISTLLCKLIIYLLSYIIILYIIANMSEEDKANHDAIEAVSYDEEHGYGSKLNTLTYAKQINKHITMDDINRFMKRVSFRNKKGNSNCNSFIVKSPRDEFMVDITEMMYLDGKYMYLFICIDIFLSMLT